MQNILHGLERYGIGTRAQDENDFWSITVDEAIEVVFSKRRFPFYFTVPDEHINAIVLPDRLKGADLVFSMFHELGHHFLHGGDEPCIAFQGMNDSKYEAEADAVALVAMIPRSLLPHLTPEDIAVIGMRRYRERQRLAFLYGI